MENNGIKSFVIEIPGEDGGRFVAVVTQVWNVLEYWPKKKAALFEEAGNMIVG
ncbi:hypothetical protein [uncultured Methanospirillum sp.]|uniref:hypothetical protein n=1 Tax=uncultured Methanospirillum sp. TaxID=262503 RepID=UPI0029C68941|nr:hypothetical protein [uncultured Methanospirillum sp.]